MSTQIVFVDVDQLQSELEGVISKAMAELGARSVDDSCIRDVQDAVATLLDEYRAATEAMDPDTDVE